MGKVPASWILVLLAVLICSTGGQGLRAAEGDPLDELIEGFTSDRVLSFDQGYPTAVAFASGERTFVAFKHGLVLLYRGDKTPRTFLDISAEVNQWGDRGLLGIAVHPRFPDKPYVYLLFVYDPPELPGDLYADDGPDGRGARVSRLVRIEADPASDFDLPFADSDVILLGENGTFEAIGDPAGHQGSPSCDTGGGTPDSPGTPMENCIPADGPSHSIGTVIFGVDGSLFVGNGDSSRWTDVDARALRALDLDSLAGKILRTDPETGHGLPDNPFFDGDPDRNRSRVWSYGLRNPFRFAIHPETGEPFIGDAGWESWEELNTGRGANFGWPCYEGNDEGNLRQPAYEHNAQTAATCAELYDRGPDAVTAPIHSYPRDEINTAIIAGDFYRGTTYPEEYRGALFFADHNRQELRAARIDGDQLVDLTLVGRGIGGVTQIVTGPDTNLYYVILGGRNELRRLRWMGSGNQPPRAKANATPTEGEAPLLVELSSEGSFDPDGDALSFSWDLGDGSTSSEPELTHVYSEHGTYAVELTVTDPSGLSGTDSVLVIVGDTAPEAEIVLPVQGETYTIGKEIAFEGRGVDHQDGALDEEALTWELILHHAGHIHPNVFAATGRTGRFTVEDHGDDTWLELALTVTDSSGLRGSSSVAIHPETVELHFATEPSGLDLIYQGSRFETPFVVTPVVDAWREIHAPAIQQHRSFDSWSDGGDASHTILIPDEPVTRLTARYVNHNPVARVTATPVRGNFPLRVVFSGVGSSDPEGDELTYEWDFGDGSPVVEGREVEHVFEREGRYRVVLRVEDALGGAGETEVWVGGSPRRRGVGRH